MFCSLRSSTTRWSRRAAAIIDTTAHVDGILAQRMKLGLPEVAGFTADLAGHVTTPPLPGGAATAQFWWLTTC